MKGMALQRRPHSAPQREEPMPAPRSVAWLMPVKSPGLSLGGRPKTAPSQSPQRLPYGGATGHRHGPASVCSRESLMSASRRTARSARSPPPKSLQPGRRRDVIHGWRPRSRPKPLEDEATLDRTLVRWIKSYNEEQTVFSSDFLSAEVKLREAGAASETLRLGGDYVPPRNLAIVTCDVLLSIAKQFGRFEGLMNLLASNVMRCVFPPRTDPAYIDAASVSAAARAAAPADDFDDDDTVAAAARLPPPGAQSASAPPPVVGDVDLEAAPRAGLVYMVPWYEMWSAAMKEQRRLAIIVGEREDVSAMRDAVQSRTKQVAQLLDGKAHFRMKVAFRGWCLRLQRQEVAVNLMRRRARRRLAPRFFGLWRRFAEERLREKEVEQYRADIVDLLDAEQEKHEELAEAYDELLSTSADLAHHKEIIEAELQNVKEEKSKKKKLKRDRVIDRARSFRTSIAKKHSDDPLGETARRPSIARASVIRASIRGTTSEKDVDADATEGRAAAFAAPFELDYTAPAFNWAKKQKLRNSREATTSTDDFLHLRNLRDSRSVQVSREWQTEQLPGGGPLGPLIRASKDAQAKGKAGAAGRAALKKAHKPVANTFGPRRTHAFKERADLDHSQCLELATDALVEKIKQDAADRVTAEPFQHLRPFFVDFLLRKFGILSLATKFRRAVETTIESAPSEDLHPRLRVFALLYGLKTADSRHLLDDSDESSVHSRDRRGHAYGKASGAAEGKGSRKKKKGGGNAAFTSKRAFNLNADESGGFVQFFAELVLGIVGSSADLKELFEEADDPSVTVASVLAGCRGPFRSLRHKQTGAYYGEILKDAVLGADVTERPRKKADAEEHKTPLARVMTPSRIAVNRGGAAPGSTGSASAFEPRCVQSSTQAALAEKLANAPKLLSAGSHKGGLGAASATAHGFLGYAKPTLIKSNSQLAAPGATGNDFGGYGLLSGQGKSGALAGGLGAPSSGGLGKRTERLTPRTNGRILRAQAAMRFESIVPLDDVLERLLHCWPLERKARMDQSPPAIASALKPALRRMRRTVRLWRSTRDHQYALAHMCFRRADALIHSDDLPRGVFSYVEFEELVQDHCNKKDADRQDVCYLFRKWHELCHVRNAAARIPRDEKIEENFLADIRDPTAKRAALDEMWRMGDARSADASVAWLLRMDAGERQLEAMTFELDVPGGEEDNRVEAAARDVEARVGDVNIAARAFADVIWLSKTRLEMDLEDDDEDTAAS